MNAKKLFVVIMVILTVVTAIVADQIHFQNTAKENCGVMYMILEDGREYKVDGYRIMAEDGFTFGGLGYYARYITVSWFDEYSQEYIERETRTAASEEIKEPTVWAGDDYRIDTFRVKRLLTEHMKWFKYDTYSCISLN